MTEASEADDVPDVLLPGDVGPMSDERDSGTSIEEPAKVMRIGSMIRQLLEEVKSAGLDEPSRERMRQIYDTSVQELSASLSDDLRDELSRLALPFGDDDVPSEAELRVAQAQLVGWLEGLFHGIQAALFAQQMQARQQLEQMRSLPPGAVPGQPGPPGGAPDSRRPGVYL
jgi:Bacterial proteasome activator